MARRPTRLVLFDIDGTLISTGRAGVRGMNAAFGRLYGRADALDGVPLAGRTDLAIVRSVFEALGIAPTGEAVARLRETYVACLADVLAHPMAGREVLAGVTEALAACEARDDVGLGLLSGNFERGAEVKLSHFGLWERFAFGAFGDAHADRRDLVPVAIARAEQATGVRVPASRVVVVGDTPLDVDCARAHGAVAVAVATGPFTAEALAEARPDVLLPTLEDLDALTAAIDAV